MNAPNPNYRAAVEIYERQVRDGFSFQISALTHFEELIAEGLSEGHARTAVRIAERRETVNFYPRCAEMIHALCDRFPPNTLDGCTLRLALGDDGLSQARAAASLGVSEATVSMKVKRARVRLEKRRC